MVYRRAQHFFVLSLLVASLFSSSRAVAQDAAPGAGPTQLSLPTIVDRLTKATAEGLKNLEHFQGKREYQLDYQGFPHEMHADMVVLVSYSAPSTEEFTTVSETGSKLILNRVIKPIMQTEQESLQPANRDRVQITADNYNFTLLDSEDHGDGCPYVLGVEPKVPNKFLFRGKIWVDGKDFAVCRIEAEPSKNPSFWIKKTDIHHSYLKIGDFWLPSENESVSVVRGGGRAVLTIKYQNYEILAARSLRGIDAGSSSSSLALPIHSN